MGGRNLISLLIAAALVTVALGQTPCSEENRPGDLEACLQAIREAMLDTSRFWFGISYNENCPPEDNSTIDCYLPEQINPESSLVDVIPEVEYEAIDRYMEVQWISAPGVYSGCDTSVESTETRFFVPDPSDSVENSNSLCWDLRAAPLVGWDTATDEPGTQYTLVFMDVTYGILHALFINGNPEGNMDDIITYLGPLNPSATPHPYVALLFRQNFQNIILDEEWIERLGEDFELQLNLQEFMAAHALQGPVAVNWVNVVGDVYSAQAGADNNWSDNCAYHIGEALKLDVHSRGFIPDDFENQVFISTDVSAPPIAYNVCCDSYQNDETDFTIDAIAANTELIPTVDVRSGIELDISFSKKIRDPNPQEDFLGETHLLMIVDADFPDDTVSTPTQPVIHMMVTDIPDGVYDMGTQLHPFLGPLPPDSEPHYYYFLLYSQPEDTVIDSTEDYTTDCSPNFCCMFRCVFNITQFVGDFNLDLIGASFWSSINDPWVNYSYIQTGGNPDDYCAGDPDYPECNSGFQPITLY